MKTYLLKLAQDRLVWFIAVGLVLFAIDAIAERQNDKRILVDLPLVEKLVAQWQGQTKRQPTAVELDALIEGYIREEILVREAQSMGLDDDDIIIRRRLAQKVEFFLSENDPPALPDEAELRQWFEDNRGQYDTPPNVSWQHVFAADETSAKALLDKLQKDDSDWRALGQPFMLNRAYARQNEAEMAQLMGGEFAAKLMQAKDMTSNSAATQAWIGPVRSAYGWHIVKITARQDAQAAAFEPLANRIAADWQDEQARLARLAAWRELRASYDIVMVPVEQ